MAIQLSNITFTNWADVVPTSGVEVIFNASLTNTLAGNDAITGLGFWRRTGNSSIYGIYNSGTLNTAEGNDIVRGVYNPTRYSSYGAYDGLLNNIGNLYLNNDYNPILNDDDNLILNDDDSNMLLPVYGYGIYNSSTLLTGEGDDIIDGTNTAESQGLYHPMGSVGIYNQGTINTGNGADSLISDGKLINSGEVLLGQGDDSITVNTNLSSRAIENYTIIEAGDGNDTITSYGVIYNEGTINASNGNDSIIAERGFRSGLSNTGSVFLGEGEDYIKSFGMGEFYGGGGNDTLELTSGIYMIGIWGTQTSFSKNDQVMVTYEFEKLIAGSTTYDFTNLPHYLMV